MQDVTMEPGWSKILNKLVIQNHMVFRRMVSERWQEGTLGKL